jgi:transposase
MRIHGRTTNANGDGFRRLEVITGVGRRRWSDEDKARIVAESLDPATTSSAVARRYGLHASQLFVWRQQLERSAGRMEIALGPAVVRVGADVDAAALRRVLEAVRGLA